MDASDVVSRVCHGQAKGWAAKLEYISFHDVNDRRDSLCFGQSRWRRIGQTRRVAAGSKNEDGKGFREGA
jgi:hypothetical protein